MPARRAAPRSGNGAAEAGGLTGDVVAPHPVWGAQAYAYVRDNTPAGDDGLLPGLCLYAQQWLSQLASPQFRDTAASPPSVSLSRYFDNTRVEALITVYDEKAEGTGRLGGGGLGGGLGGAGARGGGVGVGALQLEDGPVVGESLQGALLGLRDAAGRVQEAAQASLAAVGDALAAGQGDDGACVHVRVASTKRYACQGTWPGDVTALA